MSNIVGLATLVLLIFQLFSRTQFTVIVDGLNDDIYVQSHAVISVETLCQSVCSGQVIVGSQQAG